VTTLLESPSLLLECYDGEDVSSSWTLPGDLWRRSLDEGTEKRAVKGKPRSQP